VLGFDIQITLPPGAEFPPPGVAGRPAANGVPRTAFNGWPTPEGHRAAGAEAMIATKEEGLREAEALLAEVRAVAPRLAPEDARFLVHLFEDLALLARANRLLLEAMAHFFHLQQGISRPPFPDRDRLAELLAQIRSFAAGWEARYPAGRYFIAGRLYGWVDMMTDAALICG
jgi:hypothetical protein